MATRADDVSGFWFRALQFLLMACVVLALVQLSRVGQAAPFAYASNRSSDSLTVIDLATGDVREVPVAATPRGVAVHPDGSQVFVAGDGVLSIVDPVTLDTQDVVLPRASAGGVIVHPDGTRVLVAHRHDSQLSIVSRSGALLGSVGGGILGAYRIAASPAGDFAYIVNRAGELAQLDLNHMSDGFRPLSLGGELAGPLAPDPKGLAVDVWGTLYVASAGNRNVQAIGIAPGSGAARFALTVASGFEPGGLGIASTLGFGQRIYAADPDGDRLAGLLYQPDVAGQGGEPLAVAGGADGLLVIGNDDDVTGLAADPNFGSVTVIDAGGRFSVPAGRNPDNLAIGPDSQGDLNCSPNPLEFVYASRGQQRVGTISVNSVGSAPLRIGDLAISGRDAGAFRIENDGCSRSTLAPGQQCQLDVRFTAVAPQRTSGFGSLYALALGSYRAAVEIQTDAGGASLRVNELRADPVTNLLGTRVLTRSLFGGP